MDTESETPPIAGPSRSPDGILNQAASRSDKLDAETHVRLENLVAQDSDGRPNYPYSTLIRAAINSSPRRELTLNGLFEAFLAHFPFFKDCDEDWRGAVRSNLENKALFVGAQATGDAEQTWGVVHEATPGKEKPRTRKATKRNNAHRVADFNVAQAKRFKEELARLADDEKGGPHLVQGYALGFDRQVAQAAVDALTEMLREPEYRTAGRGEAARIGHPATLALFGDLDLDGQMHMGDIPSRPYPLTDVNVAASSPQVADAARTIHDILFEAQPLLPLPAGLGNRAMQTAASEKPDRPMAETIRAIILRSPERQLSVSHILEALQDAHPYYRQSLSDTWKTTARNVLASHECFVKEAHPGRADLWWVDEDTPVEVKVPSARHAQSKNGANGTDIASAPNIRVMRAADVPGLLATFAAVRQQNAANAPV